MASTAFTLREDEAVLDRFLCRGAQVGRQRGTGQKQQAQCAVHCIRIHDETP